MNSNKIKLVRGKEALVNLLGYFPEFCDAKLLEITFIPYRESGAELSILLHYIDMDLNLDLKSKLTLRGVSDMKFRDMSIENIIDNISINDSNDLGVSFNIEACAGFAGSCKCKILDIEIISSMPYS